MASDPTDFASVGPSIGRTGGAAVCSAGLRAHRAALCSAERTYMEPTVFAVDGTTIGHDGVAAICSAKLTAVDPTTFAAVSPPPSMLTLQPSAKPSSLPSSWLWVNCYCSRRPNHRAGRLCSGLLSRAHSCTAELRAFSTAVVAVVCSAELRAVVAAVCAAELRGVLRGLVSDTPRAVDPTIEHCFVTAGLISMRRPSLAQGRQASQPSAQPGSGRLCSRRLNRACRCHGPLLE